MMLSNFDEDLSQQIKINIQTEKSVFFSKIQGHFVLRMMDMCIQGNWDA